MRNAAGLLTAVMMAASSLLAAAGPGSAVAAGGDPPEDVGPQVGPTFTLIEMDIDIAIVATIAAIAIPNLIEARKGSNEASAIGALRTISTAQSLYREADKDGNGIFDYATALTNLSENGRLIDDVLASGAKQGYYFEMLAANLTNWSGGANPATPGRSGDRSFFIDETGVIRYSTCSPSSLNDTPIRGAPIKPGATIDWGNCEGADEAVELILVEMLASLDTLASGLLLPAVHKALTGMDNATLEGILIGLDTDGDEAISFQDLLEDPRVLNERSMQMSKAGGDPQAAPGKGGAGNSTGSGSFFDVFVDLSLALGEELRLGLGNEVVEFAVPISSLQDVVLDQALALLDQVHALDHFKCYVAAGDSPGAAVDLQDPFDARAQTWVRAEVLDAGLFCNPTRKVHADGTGVGIANVDGHLTGYGLDRGTGESTAPASVVVYNQFGPRQLLDVLQPVGLFVPTQKALVDGEEPSGGGGLPEGLDHFKCYAVRADQWAPRELWLEDQFDAAGEGGHDVKVGKAVLFCTPTRKVHDGNAVGIENGGHLTCYEIQAPAPARTLEVNNQFGDQQKVVTGRESLLCVPSVKRIPRPNPVVTEAFQLLAAQVAGVSDDALNQGQRNSFIVKLEHAAEQYAEGNLCGADHALNAYLNEARALRKASLSHPPDPGRGKGANGPAGSAAPVPGPADLAEDMINRGTELMTGMSQSFFDVFFDVFIEGSRCFVAGIGAAPTVEIQRSDNRAFSGRVTFGRPAFETLMGGGETWTRLSVPGLEPTGGVPGLPAVPYWHGLIAVPEGAEAVFLPPPDPDVPPGPVRQLNLYPFQGEAADQSEDDNRSFNETFADPAFVKDLKAYAVDAFFPPDPCVLTPVGQFRDLKMAQIACAAGQYNPATDELRLFSSVAFDVRFRGGNGTFITERTLSPFESAPALVMDSTINHAVVSKYVAPFDLTTLGCTGEELLILTHPNFRGAADNLSAWKQEKGIATTVIEVGSPTTYNTSDKIDDLIEDRYDDCAVRPSYVLLMGDVSYLPPAQTDYNTTFPSCGTCGDPTTGSDWGYAVYVQILFDALFPDFAVGRISVNNAEEADIVVNKTIQYESDPPFLGYGSGGPFYTTAGFASVFQCCRMNDDGSPLGNPGTDQRAFVETSERVRDTLLGQGKSVQRLYDQTTAFAYEGDDTPNRYFGGALMPATLRAGSGFAWDANTADVRAAWNEGRFLMLHRGHGADYGWADPALETGDIQFLESGELLPVVYSVNCASGYFDRETDTGWESDSFMEYVLRKEGGGMVGGLGDNRNSPTWANNALTRGFFDATWPTTVGDYGGATVHRRLGDVLNHGKVYLLTQVGVEQTAGEIDLQAAVAEYIMWHAFGDPTLEMWTANPQGFALPAGFEVAVDGYDIDIGYKVDGAVITAFELTKDGARPYARGVVIDKDLTLEPFNPGPLPPDLESLFFSASFPNAVSTMLSAQGTGPQSLAPAFDEGAFAEPHASGETLVDAPMEVLPGAGVPEADAGAGLPQGSESAVVEEGPVSQVAGASPEAAGVRAPAIETGAGSADALTPSALDTAPLTPGDVSGPATWALGSAGALGLGSLAVLAAAVGLHGALKAARVSRGRKKRGPKRP